MRHRAATRCVRPLAAGLMLLGTGCADPVTAPREGPVLSAHGRSGSTVSVPFKGRAQGQDVSVTFEATGIRIIAEATGNATGLGRFTEVLDYVLAYDLVNFAGTAAVTAADGSQLFLAFTGSIPGFANQVFPLPYTAQYTITGGTGRLAGSGGGGTLNGIDYGAGAFEFTFAGSRTFPR